MAISAGAAVAVTLLVRLPFLFWPLTVDEGSYAYTTHWWFRGLTLYSHDLWFDRPQAIFLAYAAGARLLGGSTVAIRLWGALWAAAGAFGASLIAGRLWGPRAAWASMILAAVFYAAPGIEGFTANAEVFMLVPATFSAYCLLTERWAWAGALASLATLLKPSGLAALVFGVIWLVSVKAGWRDWLYFLIAATPLPLLSLLHATFTVGLSAYFDAIVWYRLGVNIATGYQPEGPALDGWLRTASVWGPLMLPACAGLSRLRGRSLLFASLWLGTSVAGVAMGGHWLMHYFSQFVLPLAAVAGAGLVVLVADAPRAVRYASLPFLALGVAWFIATDGTYFTMTPADGIARLYGRPGYAVGRPAADYLRAHAAPNDMLYVAFYEAEIYDLSGLRSSTPYLFRLDLERLPGAFDDVVQDLADRKPAYVLDLKQPLAAGLDTGRFYRALKAAYVPDATFDGAVLYRRAH